MKIMKIGNNGFTLIEVIASLVIMGIVAVVAAMGLARGVQAYVTTRTSSDAIQRAESALNRIKLEFMNMDTVTAAGADTITFTSNGTTDGISRFQGIVYNLRVPVIRLIYLWVE